jgi:hypothetical protein
MERDIYRERVKITKNIRPHDSQYHIIGYEMQKKPHNPLTPNYSKITVHLMIREFNK